MNVVHNSVIFFPLRDHGDSSKACCSPYVPGFHGVLLLSMATAWEKDCTRIICKTAVDSRKFYHRDFFKIQEVLVIVLTDN